MNEAKIVSFEVEGSAVVTKYVETIEVTEGVMCDVYAFPEDESKDLAIVTVGKGFKTPLQRVLSGDKTLEGWVSGQGRLTVWSEDGTSQSHDFGPDQENDSVTLEVGQLVQWHANTDTNLVFYEVCEPPYKDGRFENLPDAAALTS